MTFIDSPGTHQAMRTSSRSVGALLSSVPTLKAISVQLELAAALQQAVAKALPRALSEHVRVVLLEGQILVLEADSGALAAKLRHLGPRLLATLRVQFPGLAGIRFEVRMLQRTQPRRGAVRRIEPTGKQALARLAGSLPGGDLKAALERLLCGQARSDGEDQPLEGEERESHGGDK
jgi:hypothetical protein